MTTVQLQLFNNTNKTLGIRAINLDEKTLKVEQFSVLNGKLYTNNQLYNKGKKLCQDKHIIPVVFSFNANEINLNWITTQMELYKLNIKTLSKHLPLQKEKISNLLSGKISLNNQTKALFFYYFLAYSFNK